MAWWTWGPVSGALVRRVPATVVNVSAGGCLIETAAPLLPGEVGVLQVEAQDSQPEAVRVCRLVERPGGPLPYCAGTEFLVLDAPSPGSIRGEAVRFATREKTSRLARTGEKSGTAPTRSKAAGPSQSADPRELAGDPSEL